MSPTLFFNHRNNNNQIPSKRLCSFSCNACCLACVVCPWSCKLVSSQFHSYTTLSVFPTVYRKGSLLSRRQSLPEHYRAKLPTTESESKLMTRHSFMWRTLRFEFYCGVSRRCPGKTLRLRKIAPLCSLKLVVDAISGFHFLKETLETTFNLVRRTCSSNPLSVKSMIPSPSKEANISPDVAKCFVKVLAGFATPSTLPMITCLVCTSSCIYMCPTATCLILPMPIRLAACNAAEESHQTLGVSTFNPKSSQARFLTYTELCAQWVKERISASPELVAGTPGWVVLPVSTTVPAKTITSPELDLRVFSHPAQPLSVYACNGKASSGFRSWTSLLTCP